MILIISILISVIVIFSSIRYRFGRTPEIEMSNPELEEYYMKSSEDANKSILVKLLSKASYNNLLEIDRIMKKKAIVKDLYSQNLVSEDYFYQFEKKSYDLKLERYLIESEIELHDAKETVIKNHQNYYKDKRSKTPTLKEPIVDILTYRKRKELLAHSKK